MINNTHSWSLKVGDWFSPHKQFPCKTSDRETFGIILFQRIAQLVEIIQVYHHLAESIDHSVPVKHEK